MIFSAAYAIINTPPAVSWAWLLIAAIAYYTYDTIDPNLRVRDTPTEDIYTEYDFIIVGAGSAGSVLASRLTEVADWNVLLLEAGGEETEITEVPALARFLQNSNLDWQFKTEPSNNACLAQANRRCNWPRGKVLGGSSSINGQIYIRGNRKDYDLWEALGNPGWGYEDALYYFKKSEDIRVPELRNSPYRSTGGPLTVSNPRYATPLMPAFLEASEELGYTLRDINGESQSGFMRIQMTTRDGHRCSAAKAFLRPARNRRNLDIAMRSYVTKVLIDPESRVAYGVEFVREGKTYTVSASKEVIVSAGAIQSPQLLMLSGIGPKEDLRKLSIPVLQDLKVGYNLQDHIQFVGVQYRISKPIFVNDTRLEVTKAVLEWAKAGTGPLTLQRSEVFGNVHTRYVNASEDWPDIQLAIFPLYTLNTSALDTQDESQPGSSTSREESKRSIDQILLDSFVNENKPWSSRGNLDQLPYQQMANQHSASALTRYASQGQADGSNSYASRNSFRPPATQNLAGLINYLKEEQTRPTFNSNQDSVSLIGSRNQAGGLSRYWDQSFRRPTATQNQADGSTRNPDQNNRRPATSQNQDASPAEGSEAGTPEPTNNDGWGINVALLHPKSRGRVKLQSKDPFVYPLLIHNYFTEEIDMLTLIDGVKIALAWNNTRAMQQFNSTFNYNNPNCSHIPLYTDDFWRCAIRYNSATVYHQVGTCRMGPSSDSDAVVDSQLRVYGIDRLRVIDSSIMPTVPGGNTNAPSIMIGEKGADLIKETWRWNDK